MIRLNFLAQREPISFTIESKTIKYFDRKWTNGITFMPKDNELVKHLLINQRRFSMAQQIISWINESNSGKNLEEYINCKTEEELANLVRRDAMSKGLVESK